ncbi:MAG: aminotransferase class I/II-fold pyridoxal phosphate-dependent enzyme, partial [Lachnospiraceae bacterium]|nr:aminotransferase class I/II-fold pyridoxal phosphate-dependent enzyme [Lachnospiraceae bacterium]
SIFLISDEPYREIVYGGRPIHFVAKYYANTLTCYSFSKSLSLPGERIGYLAAAPTCEKAKTLVQMCGQISRGIGHNCPSSIMQMAVAKVIDLTSDLSVYERNANLIYETMRDVGLTCQKPDGTFYIFPKAPITDATEFAMTALKYNLVLVPSDSFGRPGYVRLAYCVGEEKVARAMQAFREMMAKEKFC